MRRRRTLIASPLEWAFAETPVRRPAIPVIAERGGTQIRTPRPVAIIDTREQNPFSFWRFSGWFKAVKHKALALGDYSIEGMENSCIVERKDLCDLIHSLTTNRPVFIERLRRMSRAPHRLLVITAPLSEIKTKYPHSPVNPNQIMQSLVAVLVGLQVPFLCADTHELGAELTASFLYQAHLRHWLETHDFGPRFSDMDI